MWQRRASGSVIAYLGGRFVLGSGRTWPHDLRFLTGFFSGSGVLVVEAGGGVKVVWVSAVRPASIVRSGCLASEAGWGDIISTGLTVVVGAGLVPKREGYISSGVERRDSAGEPSNLMFGDAARVQECISDILNLAPRRRT